jgi:hypothetical protein
MNMPELSSTSYVSKIGPSEFQVVAIILNIFIDNGLSVFLGEGRKNVDLPNIFGIIKGIFRIESDRAD